MFILLLACSEPATAIPPPPNTVGKPAPKPASRTDVHLVKVVDGALVVVAPGSLDENFRLYGDHPRFETLNKVEDFSIQVVPPDGEGGKWGQSLTRGSDWFSDHQRHVLASEGLFIVPTVVGAQDHVMVHTQKRFTLITTGLTTTGDDFTLSGPPGGPLGLAIHPYRDLKTEDQAKWITKQNADSPDFSMGKPLQAKIGGRTFQAHTYTVGQSMAKSTYVVVFWPDIPRGTRSITSGLMVEFFTGAADGKGVMEHPSIQLAAGSLVVNPDP